MSAPASGVAALVAAYGVGWLVREFAAGRVLDRPGPRSSHTIARTRLGGVAVAAGLAAGVAGAAGGSGAMVGVALAAGIAGGGGLAEDVAGLAVPWRVLAQATAAAAALLVILDDAPVWAWALALLWIVGFTNAFNFMDGIDGLAGIQLVVAGAAWVAVGLVEDVDAVTALGAVAAGCGAGFVPHNFPRARMFMGDLGAYAAGAWLATGALAGVEQGVAPVAMLAPLAVFGFDATWTLAGRARRGENVFRPHRQHLYQRLVGAGWSHPRTTSLVASLVALAAGGGLVALIDEPWSVVASAATVTAVCGAYLALVKHETAGTQQR